VRRGAIDVPVAPETVAIDVVAQKEDEVGFAGMKGMLYTYKDNESQ
jgi:hypothetical protein